MGVFVGIGSVDFVKLVQKFHPSGQSPYIGPGGSLSVASGRLSYTFGAQVQRQTVLPTVAVGAHASCVVHIVHISVGWHNYECTNGEDQASACAQLFYQRRTPGGLAHVCCAGCRTLLAFLEFF
eukprot:5299816-Pyramimonas_sp.AAC.1